MKNQRSTTNGVVLALGSGSAPGLAHVGVLQVLAEHEIPVRAIAGCSIGAEIGAFVASGMSVADLTTVASSFDWKDTLQLFLPGLTNGGLVSGINIMNFLNGWIGAHRIEELGMGYLAVATDLEGGTQVILDRGDLVAAVRASISTPGLLVPHRVGSRLLVDGALVNPVPFDVARAHFGGPVVAVSLHGDRANTTPARRAPQWGAQWRQLLQQSWIERAPALRGWLEAQVHSRGTTSDAGQILSARQVLERSAQIMQAEIIRWRLASNPPDLMISPEVADIGMLEFYRAKEAIAAGRAAAEAHLDRILDLCAAGHAA